MRQVELLHESGAAHLAAEGRGARVVLDGHVPAFQAGAHFLAQVGQHGPRVGGEGARAALDVVAGQRDAREHHLRVQHRGRSGLLAAWTVARQLVFQLALEHLAGLLGHVVGEDGIGAGGGLLGGDRCGRGVLAIQGRYLRTQTVIDRAPGCLLVAQLLA